jgi:hypothetical protein
MLGPIWGPIGPHLGPSGPIWAHFGSTWGPCWAHFGLFGAGPIEPLQVVHPHAANHFQFAILSYNWKDLVGSLLTRTKTLDNSLTASGYDNVLGLNGRLLVCLLVWKPLGVASYGPQYGPKYGPQIWAQYGPKLFFFVA